MGPVKPVARMTASAEVTSSPAVVVETKTSRRWLYEWLPISWPEAMRLRSASGSAAAAAPTT